MFTGDVVNNDMIPFLAEGGSLDWIKQVEYTKDNYSYANFLYPGHGQSGSAKILLDKQLNYINTFRSFVEHQLQSEVDEKSAKITEYGKIKIKNELQRLFPNYIPVAKLPDNIDLNDMNIDAVVKEINKNKNN